MQTFLRSVMLLALIVWVGGIIFFAFVEAPVSFRVLPSTHLAGLVVGRTLTLLHWIGFASGAAFLLASMALQGRTSYRVRPLAGAHLLVFTMLALTAVSQYVVTPAMERTRQQQQSLKDSVALQQQFQQLHNWSERLEGGVLLLGLGTVVLTARRLT